MVGRVVERLRRVEADHSHRGAPAPPGACAAGERIAEALERVSEVVESGERPLPEQPVIELGASEQELAPSDRLTARVPRSQLLVFVRADALRAAREVADGGR